MIISVDFDGVLSNSAIAEIIKGYSGKHKIVCLTSRYDDFHKHNSEYSDNNDDLYKRCGECRISDIFFTNREAKRTWLNRSNINIHIDDNSEELKGLGSMGIMSVNINNPKWSNKLKRYAEADI